MPLKILNSPLGVETAETKTSSAGSSLRQALWSRMPFNIAANSLLLALRLPLARTSATWIRLRISEMV